VRYSFDELKEYTVSIFKKYLDTVDASTDEERKKEEKRKDVLRRSINVCYAGGEKERQYVKQFINRVLTGQIDVFIDDKQEEIKVTPENYGDIFPWDNSYKLPTQVKFLGLLYYHKESYGAGALTYLIDKYHLDQIRPLITLQGDNRQDRGIYIDYRDISAIFDSEKVVFNYELAMDVLVQMIYEEYKGNGCIDELMYQSIDDIGIGLSGLQTDVNPIHLKGKKLSHAYDGAWVKYKGMLMHLMFLSFHDFTNLARVTRQLVAYQQQGSFSEKDGYKMGYGADGSRRTSAITPFAENCVAWVRKFTAKSLSNKELVNPFAGTEDSIDNVDSLIAVEKVFVRGGATIPICGPQGAGKTTKLEAISEYIQNWFGIRMIESEFEARIKWRYPEKNIVTVQTQTISPEESYEFSLRTSGDIYIVSEVRSDEMMVNITRTANRGGRSVLFTYHPNKPRSTIIEVANSLIRQKLYTTLKDAMYTTLETIKCCIHIGVDIEKKFRYYNIYEYRPTEIVLDEAFKSLKGSDRSDAFMTTMLNFYQKTTGEEYFEVVPIIRYNRHTNAYEFENTISDRFYEELLNAMSLNEEKDELEKLFRPQEYLDRYLQKHTDIELNDKLIDELGLNKKFLGGA
jgi:type IV secretory pathway ATPase VirB11/archaellum biosynthesis ATPase